MNLHGLILLGCVWSASCVRSVVLGEDGLDTDEASETILPIGKDWRYGGVLKVKCTVWDSDPVIVSLNTDSGEAALSFSISLKARTITRSSDYTSDVEEWGTWPNHDVSYNNFQAEFWIERTHEAWKVSIDGQRTPWFDFPFATDQVVTKVQTLGARQLVLLIHSECTTPCTSAECDSCEAGGENISDFSQCRSISQDTPRKCEVPASKSSELCCREQHGNLKFKDVQPKSWAMVRHDDEHLVRRGCAAFATNHVMCSKIMGTPVRILSKDASNGKAKCWSPLLDTDVNVKYNNPIYLPSELLEPKPVARWKDFGLPPGAPGLKVNPNNGFIYNVTGDAAERGVPHLWYINRINGQSYNRKRFMHVMYSGGAMEFTVTDIEQPFGQCRDTPGWKDRDSDGCGEYRSKNWCTADGSATRDWKGNRRQFMWLFNRPYDFAKKADKKHGQTGAQACCTCGGGKFSGTDPIDEEPVDEPEKPEKPIVPPVVDAPTPAPLDGDYPEQVFVKGAEDEYLYYMGLYKLNLYRVPDAALVGPAIYENVHHSFLYFVKTTGKWTISQDFANSFPVLTASTSSSGDTPADVFPGDWTTPSSNVVKLMQADVTSCGAETGTESDCWCPENEYECQADVFDMKCLPGLISNPPCGTVARCCNKFPVCADSGIQCATTSGYEGEWPTYPDSETKKGGIQWKNVDAICPSGGCNPEICCARTCLALDCGAFEVERNASNTKESCPTAGCDQPIDQSFCCILPETTTAAPTAPEREGASEFVDCDECEFEGSEKSAVAYEIQASGMSHSSILQNFVVRNDCLGAIRDKMLSLVPLANACVVQIFPGSGSDLVEFKILLLPEDDSKVEDLTRAVLQLGETDVLGSAIHESLKKVANVDKVVDEEGFAINPLGEARVVTLLHNKKLAQRVEDVGSAGIWWAHGMSVLSASWAMVVEHKFIFAAGGLVSLLAFTGMWFWVSAGERESDNTGIVG